MATKALGPTVMVCLILFMDHWAHKPWIPMDFIYFEIITEMSGLRRHYMLCTSHVEFGVPIFFSPFFVCVCVCVCVCVFGVLG